MAELLTAHIADWIRARPAEARAWWQVLVETDPVARQAMERVTTMAARLDSKDRPEDPGRRRYYDRVKAFTRTRILAGRAAPVFPSYEQACKTGLSVAHVNEVVDDRNRLITADTVVRLREGTVIARLVARHHLKPALGNTAALYLSIWESAGMTMRVTGSYAQGTGGGDGASVMAQSEAMAIARSELRALRGAIEEKHGAETWRLAERVVINDESVTQMGFAAYPPWRARPSQRTATRTGMRVLRAALTAAAAYLHGLKRRRRRYASTRPASSDERQAYFAKGADHEAVLQAMRQTKERKANRAGAKAARKGQSR